MTVASLFTDMAGPSPFLIYETHMIPLGLIQRSWILPPTGQKPPNAQLLAVCRPAPRWLGGSAGQAPGASQAGIGPSPPARHQTEDPGQEGLLISRQLLTAIKTNHKTLSAVGSLVPSLKVVGLQSHFS